MTRKKAAPRIDVITLFPEMFEGAFGRSIVGKARERKQVRIGFVNPRDFAKDRHRTVDDRPYGGGPGMVLMAQPLFEAIKSVRKRGSKVVFLTPQGKPFTQRLAESFAKEKHLILLCGHYEGVDERILKHVDMEVSIGDYVLTGGEIPAMAVADAVVRLLPGVLDEDATRRESFASAQLDHPQYTRPSAWRGAKVPEVLLCGDHAKIEAWRREAAAAATGRKRPDLTAAK
ncbi:MAG: tRNA (guanosine(37)-N1)-methyltransferase TrmD [Elusimicrobia bacterium]|nr:tRNA (guanosine(37)-N1)-methyltransferase TrmD [Elusimicrobiota bacterium]